MYNTRYVNSNPNMESYRHLGIHANKVPSAWTENREAPCRSRAPICNILGRSQNLNFWYNQIWLAIYSTRLVSANPNIESYRHVDIYRNKVPRAWTENREAPCPSRAPIVTF